MTNSAWLLTIKRRVVVSDEAALLEAAKAAGGDGADVQSALQWLVRAPSIADVPGLSERSDVTWAESVYATPDE